MSDEVPDHIPADLNRASHWDTLRARGLPEQVVEGLEKEYINAQKAVEHFLEANARALELSPEETFTVMYAAQTQVLKQFVDNNDINGFLDFAARTAILIGMALGRERSAGASSTADEDDEEES